MYLGKAQDKTVQRKDDKIKEEAPHRCAIRSWKEHSQRGPKVSQSQQRSAQHLPFFLVALVKDQLLFP